MSKRRAFLAVWVVTLVVRSILAFGFHRLDDNRAEVQNIALTLAATGRFADPYIIPTGPTAHAAPVYPAINALLYRWAGNTQLADRLRQVLNMGFAATVYGMLPLVAAELGLGMRAGLWAGFGGALLPVYYWGELPGAFENGLAALLMVVMTWLAAPHIARAAPVRFRKAWTLGGWAGLLVLTSPAMLPPVAALAILVEWRARPPRGVPVRGCAAFLLVLAPWTIRNWIRFHELIPVRSNLGLELALSNNGQAGPDTDANMRHAYTHAHHPFQNAQVAAEVKALGEVEYSRRMLGEAIAWIEAHPRRFAALSCERMVEFWMPVSQYHWHAAGMAAMTLLAFGGWAIAWLRARSAAYVLIAVPVSYSMSFVLIETCIRYTYPIAWSLLLAASALTLARPGRNSRR